MYTIFYQEKENLLPDINNIKAFFRKNVYEIHNLSERYLRYSNKQAVQRKCRADLQTGRPVKSEVRINQVHRDQPAFHR